MNLKIKLPGSVVLVVVLLPFAGCLHPRSGITPTPPQHHVETIIADKWLVRWSYRGTESHTWVWGGARSGAVTMQPPSVVPSVPESGMHLFRLVVTYPHWSGNAEISAPYLIWVGTNLKSLDPNKEPERVGGHFLSNDEPDAVVLEPANFGACRGWIETQEKHDASGELRIFKVDGAAVLERDLVVTFGCELWASPTFNYRPERFEFERQCVEEFIRSVRVERLEADSGI